MLNTWDAGIQGLGAMAVFCDVHFCFQFGAAVFFAQVLRRQRPLNTHVNLRSDFYIIDRQLCGRKSITLRLSSLKLNTQYCIEQSQYYVWVYNRTINSLSPYSFDGLHVWVSIIL